METRLMNRRVMLKALGLSGLAVVVVACGDGLGDLSQLQGINGPVVPAEGKIAANHGHVAIISEEQLKKGEAVVIDIHGTSNHGHNLALTAEQVVAVREGKKVSVVSTTTGTHGHTVIFNADAPA